MITEVPKGNAVMRWIDRARGGDLYVGYRIPDRLDHQFPQPGGVSVHLLGARDDLQVRFETPSSAYSINRLAPRGTSFSVDDLLNRVSTNAARKTIRIPVRRKTRDVLPYGILHGIARLRLHEDENWHQRSEEAHSYLSADLAHLYAFGKVRLSEDPLKRQEEIEAWNVAGEEERKTSELTLELLQQLLNSGFNPIPSIKNHTELTVLVNSDLFLRTYYQHLLNPAWTGRQIAIPMTLTEERVRELVPPPWFGSLKR